MQCLVDVQNGRQSSGQRYIRQLVDTKDIWIVNFFIYEKNVGFYHVLKIIIP